MSEKPTPAHERAAEVERERDDLRAQNTAPNLRARVLAALAGRNGYGKFHP